MKKMLLFCLLILSFNMKAQNVTLTASTNSFWINNIEYPLNSVTIIATDTTNSIGIFNSFPIGYNSFQTTNQDVTYAFVTPRAISYYLRSSGVPFANYTALRAFYDSFMIRGASVTVVPGTSPLVTSSTTKEVGISPTNGLGQYTNGVVLGGVQTITGAVRITNGTGTLVSMIIKDSSNQKAAMDVLIFKAAPVGTYTDGSAITTFNNTDMNNLVRKISVTTTDYTTYGNIAAEDIDVAKDVVATGNNTNLYAVIIVYGTPTYLTTHALRIIFGFYLD